MTEITLNESDRQILAQCAEQLGVSTQDALHEALCCLHASLTAASPQTSTGGATRPMRSGAPAHVAPGNQCLVMDDARSTDIGRLWGAARSGIRDGLRDARHLPRQYFAPLIALAYWMHDVTEGVMNRKRTR